MKIVPGILVAQYEDLHQQVHALHGHTDWLQLDVADGQFVDNVTLSLEEIPAGEFEGFSMEVHLMTEEPEALIAECKRLGIKRMIVHYEAVRDYIDTLIERIKSEGMQVSVAMNPGTTLGHLETVIDGIDAVLLMTVTPGMQGQAFMPEVLQKVQQIRLLKQDIVIGIDGGVNRATLPELLKYNIDYAVVGSAISRVDDPVAALKELQRMV